LLSLAGVVKIDQRNISDINTKKAAMAYGGSAGESLQSLMRRKPGGGM